MPATHSSSRVLDSRERPSMKLRPRPSRRRSAPSPTKGAMPTIAFETAVQKELTTIGTQEELFLRATSELSALVHAAAFDHGRAYLRYVLRDVFGDHATIYTCESDIDQAVADYAQSILQRLVRAIHYAPKLLRAYTHAALQAFERTYPTCPSDRAAQIVVGSMLFLRVLCPAVIHPEKVGFAAHSTTSLRLGVALAKLLQATVRSVATSTVTSTSTSSMEAAIPTFVTEHRGPVAAFLAHFADFQATPAEVEAELQQIDPSQSLPPRCAGAMNRAASWDVTPGQTRTALPTAMSWHGEDPAASLRVGAKERGLGGAVRHFQRKFSFKFWQ